MVAVGTMDELKFLTQHRRKIELIIISKMDELLELLSNITGVKNIIYQQAHSLPGRIKIDFEFEGGDSDLSALLSKLFEAEIPLYKLLRKRTAAGRNLLECNQRDCIVTTRITIPRILKNPLITKDLRTRMRGSRTFLLIFIHLIGLGFVMIIGFLVFQSALTSPGSLEQRRFLWKSLVWSTRIDGTCYGQFCCTRDDQRYDFFRT